MIKMLAMAVPILEGKEEKWQDFAGELSGNRKEEFKASCKRLGIRERTFLQHTPLADVVIITLEGKEPEKALYQFANGTDEFTKWYLQNVKEIHGIDLAVVQEGHISV